MTSLSFLFAFAAAIPSPAPAPGVVPVPVVAPSAPRAHPRPRKINRPAVVIARANRVATAEPIEARFVNAVQVYPWIEGGIYRLIAAPGQVTDIVLEAGEALVSVAAGDTVRWTVGDTASGTGETKRIHILVKPFEPGLKTNMAVMTDRRAYHLALESTARTAMSALSWTYPADQLLALKKARDEARAAEPVAAGLQVDRLRFGYLISGDMPPWRPLRAFDDGRQVFIEFPVTLGTGEAPPLFVVGSTGEAELVNYRVSGRYYIVDRLFQAAELRLGAKPQSIVRIALGAAPPRKGHRHGRD